MSWYLGVDAGGSFTRAGLLNTETGAVAEGQAGPGNPHAVGPEVAFEAIEQAVAGALGQAGCHAFELAGGCIGVAGLARLELPAGWEERFSDWRIPGLEIVSDLEIAHYGAFGAESGILVIAGTGSSVQVRDRTGESYVYGGWGWLLGDEGSAVDLGRSALQWLTFASDSGAPTNAFARSLLEALKVESVVELVPRIYGDAHPRQLLARLAPAVTAHASEGDRAARRIVDQAAARLAQWVKAAAGRLEGDNASGRVAYSGGVFRAASFVDAFTAACSAAGVDPTPAHVAHSPLVGALLKARGNVDPERSPALREALRRL